MTAITRERETRWERSYCPYCGVGCGLKVALRGNSLAKIKGDPDHPANYGEICAKAAHLAPTVNSLPDDCFIRRFASAVTAHCSASPAARAGIHPRADSRNYSVHGPDAVAFYGSGQLLTEDYYVFNKLAKGFIGTNNFDSNSRFAWPAR